jgi:hypothetical protein
MRSGLLIPILVIGSSAWAGEPGANEPAPCNSPKEADAAQGAKEGVIDPKAELVLRRMSHYLANLKSLSVDTKNVDEKFTADGEHKVQQVSDSRVVLERPGEMRVDRFGPAGHTTFRYDGKRFSVYNRDHNVYATASAPREFDTAIDEARERLQIDAPGGDLLGSDAYGSLTEGMSEGRYIGLEPVDGVMAHHIIGSKKDTEWQIWIKDGPEPLPLRYVVTSRDLPGNPEFTLELRNWQPNATVATGSFAFNPPRGAKRVAFAPPKKAERQGE